MIISNLAVLLAERKLKVADLVRSTGINKSTLHKLYNDESVRIDFETIDKICIALDVGVGDLLIFKKIDNNQNDNGQFGHKWSHQKVKWSQIIDHLVKNTLFGREQGDFLPSKKL